MVCVSVCRRMFHVYVGILLVYAPYACACVLRGTVVFLNTQIWEVVCVYLCVCVCACLCVYESSVHVCMEAMFYICVCAYACKQCTCVHMRLCIKIIYGHVYNEDI
jgi:hypothetical protein